MDDVIDILKEKCVQEIIIKNLHSLLHADDTLVLSFDKDLFIHKCDVLLETFRVKKLEVNLEKSCYMIINAPACLAKAHLKLNHGWLPYKPSIVYLGATFTDSGTLADDLNSQARAKDKLISIKLANFITNNLFAPITVKFKVLESCINASILYSCETWSSAALSRMETLHRKSLKVVLSLPRSTSTDLLYLESGKRPLKARIYKRQYKFWSKNLKDMDNTPDSPITKLFRLAIESNIPYVKHYINLHKNFANECECFNYYDNLAKSSSEVKVRSCANDDGSILGTYVSINPDLNSPEYYREYTLSEYNRIIITKYRVGAHRLRIQTGRYDSLSRDKRVCGCGEDVQSLLHVVFRCPITELIGI